MLMRSLLTLFKGFCLLELLNMQVIVLCLQYG